jgi:hypothetical protein
MVYQKQQEEATAIKYKRTPVDEERALHEAYQVTDPVNVRCTKCPTLNAVVFLCDFVSM